MATKAILGTKLGMTQVFDETGRALAVTVVRAGPCVVVARKQPERDGYAAVQLGFQEVPERKLNRPRLGHLRRAGIHRPLKYLREFRLAPQETEGLAALAPGSVATVEQFAPGDLVDVSAVSKGKGFAGVVKRWGLRRGPMSHGSMYHRRVGTLGATGPQRVFKGRKLPGRAGGRRVTTQGLRVVKVLPEHHMMLLHGSVPGPNGGLVEIRSSVVLARRRGRRKAAN